jgi:SAM-dependent methyltransferase
MAGHAHNDVVEQFTAQAEGFAHSHSIRDEHALAQLLELADPAPEDRVLDVACGPGLVVCAFAARVREAVGIDVTPAMIEQARRHAAERGVTNVAWQLGAIPPLPWPDADYDLVVCRYAFHHFDDPLAVLREMVRVCKPGGTVIVCDLALDPAKLDAFNAMDRLRDRSHRRALSLDGLRALYADAGLGEPRTARYGLEGDLESLLERSFPEPGGAEEVRRRFRASLVDDRLGIDARLEGGRITYRYPIALLAARRP